MGGMHPPTRAETIAYLYNRFGDALGYDSVSQGLSNPNPVSLDLHEGDQGPYIVWHFGDGGKRRCFFDCYTGELTLWGKPEDLAAIDPADFDRLDAVVDGYLTYRGWGPRATRRRRS